MFAEVRLESSNLMAFKKTVGRERKEGYWTGEGNSIFCQGAGDVWQRERGEYTVETFLAKCWSELEKCCVQISVLKIWHWGIRCWDDLEVCFGFLLKFKWVISKKITPWFLNTVLLILSAAGFWWKRTANVSFVWSVQNLYLFATLVVQGAGVFHPK